MLANEKNILAGKKVRRGGILQNMAILSLIKIGQIGLGWLVGFNVELMMTKACRSVSGSFDSALSFSNRKTSDVLCASPDEDAFYCAKPAI